MPKFSHCFPKVTPSPSGTPDKIRAFALPEDDPKRITYRNSLILAKMRGFAVYRGPPGDFSQIVRK
jgi:hypothetical protein